MSGGEWLYCWWSSPSLILALIRIHKMNHRHSQIVQQSYPPNGLFSSPSMPICCSSLPSDSLLSGQSTRVREGLVFFGIVYDRYGNVNVHTHQSALAKQSAYACATQVTRSPCCDHQHMLSYLHPYPHVYRLSHIIHWLFGHLYEILVKLFLRQEPVNSHATQECWWNSMVTRNEHNMTKPAKENGKGVRTKHKEAEIV